MKKITILAILGLMVVASTASAYAVYTFKPIDNFEKITNALIDTDKVTVYKFKDGDITCYGSYINNSVNRGTSISCVK